ncbi:branched-chain amino acid transporter AzlD [Arthrobacter pityocampae]|uniref:Branched-chain amino acid transporter AzlD n=1 Tax=Arthrobacter pityocampae TaxID=547334 RepID=A0A2S5IV26_9MICC|nr:AzlD domain-containing protein [Arthrobacter pityocampae]PPB48432.1 branched-chain amino acid transporter AzlD [Arthrobacter pityocampae]
MSLWGWVLLACAVSIATKFLGFLVPARMLDNPRMLRVAGSLTIGLLAALTATNTFASGQGLVVDARVVALAAAAVALWLRAPFLVVVAVGAFAAGVARLLGAA